MRGRLLRTFVAAGVVIFSHGVHAVEFPDMVRDLNGMQNRMVMGDEKARENVARQFDLIERTIMTLEPETWTEEKNVRAAAIYLLCGGAPTNLREIFDAKFVSDELSPLLEAALRYAEGQDEAAAKLMDFDARHFPPILGGHLALVQGGSVIGSDNARAIALLDLARLLMPASLVEEAALRREIRAVDPETDADKVSALVNRYVAKYTASPYAQNFWTELRSIVFSPSINADAELLAKFEGAIEKASTDQRLDIYLLLSRRAILNGRLGEAASKLDKAEQAADNPQAHKRIATYRNIVKSLSKGDASSASNLQDTDLSALTREDSEMLKIASGVLARLEKPAETDRHAIGASAAAPEVTANDEPPIIASARVALEKSDELLKRKTAQ